MALYRGIGGAGDSTTDATVTAVTQQATNAASSATSAANSATSAATSASSASTSATTATTKASEAATSASNAATSETNAATSASNASTSETNAATSASNAATSASNASTSETNAASSASAASTSETNAATSATTATTKASEASTSATNAATSESNASTSATNAATSATAAQTAQTAAEAAQEAIDGLYLGAQTSDPTLDNNGDPITAGDWYYNTVTAVTRIYDGSAWQNGAVSTAGFALTANNLSDLASASTARTNLGLGTAATTASTDYATAAQGATADSALQNLVEDTTPQLGGTLDANGNNINLDGNDLILNDSASSNAKVYFAAGGDNIIIRNENTGGTNNGINFDAEGPIRIRKTTLLETLLEATPDGSVDLYYDNSKKFETTTSGATVTGTLVADGLTVDTTTLVVDATNNRVGIGTASPSEEFHVYSTSSGKIAVFESTSGTGGAGPSIDLRRSSASPAANDYLTYLNFVGKDSVGTDTNYVGLAARIVDPTNGSEDGRFIVETRQAGSATNAILADTDVELYSSGSKKFETTTSGVSVTGRATGTQTTDNDLSFDMTASNQFKCTPASGAALTFTNITAGQSGNIFLDNSAGVTITAAATTKINSTDLTTISTAGTYFLSYYSDGTNVLVATSQSVTA